MFFNSVQLSHSDHCWANFVDVARWNPMRRSFTILSIYGIDMALLLNWEKVNS